MLDKTQLRFACSKLTIDKGKICSLDKGKICSKLIKALDKGKH